MSNLDVTRAILEKIKEYQRIMLFRHIRMDGDCVGASKGLKALLELTYPDKDIRIVDAQTSDFLAFLGPDDGPVPDEFCRQALGIVVDTADRQRISNQQYALCREIIKIDHHIPVDHYGCINWVEEDRPSACEMIAALYANHANEMKIDTRAATFLYLGMVTDSGRFRYSGINGDSLRLAGLMLDQGVDTETLYAHLYLQDYEALKFKAYVYEHMRRTENGAAYIHVTADMQAQFGLSFEAACNAISYLEGIRDCLCWLAFIEGEKPEEGVRVRLRSRFMTVNQLAERHHGGGHACASGATVYSREEMEQLIREADADAKNYKATHQGWM